MKKNVGSVDRAIRIVIGAGLILAGILAPVGTGAKAAMFVVAAIALATAFFST